MPSNPPNAMSIDFAAKQHEFVAYLRDPQHQPIPGDVAPARIAMYRELLFNNIDNFLTSNFPVLKQILPETEWSALAQDFFAHHQAKSPYFSEIPEEFISFLQAHPPYADRYPFLVELAHYEWVEMAVAIAHTNLPAPAPLPDDLANTPLQVSPVAWPLAYQYPVHKICPEFLPTAPPAAPTFLVVYRDYYDEVHFLEITPLTYQLLALLQTEPPTTAQAGLAQMAHDMQHPQPEILAEAGLAIVREWLSKGIVWA